jgi:hypothetical protein
MNRKVPWKNMRKNSPLIMMNDQDNFIIFRLPGSDEFVLPTKTTWEHEAKPEWNPSEVTELLLYIGSEPQTVYYVSRSSPLPIPILKDIGSQLQTVYYHSLSIPSNLRSKRLHGELTGLLYEEQDLIHAMCETFDVRNGHLHHKNMNWSVQEGFEPGCPIVATKNFAGRFAVYLTVRHTEGKFPGEYRLPTRDDFFAMHGQEKYHPVLIRMRVPFSNGTTRTIYLVNFDGITETKGVKQTLFDTSEDTTENSTDQWTREVIFEMDRNNIRSYKFEEFM